MINCIEFAVIFEKSNKKKNRTHVKPEKPDNIKQLIKNRLENKCPERKTR